MLGGTTVRDWYAQANTISVLPRVVCEWNANAFAKPYAWGSGDGTAVKYTNSYTSSPTAPLLQRDSDFSATYSTGRFGDANSLITITVPASDPQPATPPTYQSLEYYPTSSNTGNAYRLVFFAKSGGKTVDMTVVATAYNGNTVLGVCTEVCSLITSKYNVFNVEFFSYVPLQTDITKIVFDFHAYNEKSIDTQNGGAATPNLLLYIDSPRVFTITQKEAAQMIYSPVADLFKTNRPGEPFISDPRPNSAGYVNPLIANANVSPYYAAYSQFYNGDQAKARTYFLDQDSMFKYFIFNTTNTIFAHYENVFKANKIVIKLNSAAAEPTQVQVYTMSTTGGSWSSASTFTSSPFDANGLLVLYWNGSAWSTSKYTVSNTPASDNTPKYSNNTLPSTVDIAGIKVTFTTSSEVHLVEISPRLEMDISEYVVDLNITKEVSNDSLPTPIGISSSNTCTISLSNLPDQTTNKRPFGDSSTDVLYGLIDRDVILHVYMKPSGGDTSYEEVKVATMISSSWTSVDSDTSKIEAYDKVKTMSQIKVPDFYKKGGTVADIITLLLDSTGNTDYDYSALQAMPIASQVIDDYWTVKGVSLLEALQKVLLPYQTGMYIDEVGAIRFYHASSFVATSSPTFTVTDVTSGSTLPNIISLNENQENMPSKVSVKYSYVGPSEITVLPSQPGTVSARHKAVETWSAPTELLGFVKLKNSLSKTSTRLSYLYNPVISTDSAGTLDTSIMQSYTGYVLVGDEIIKFDGRLFTFTSIGTTTSKVVKAICRSASEVDSIRDSLIATYGGKVVVADEAQLCNLTRGCFNTEVKDHIVDVNTGHFTVVRDDKNANTRTAGTVATDISEDNYSLKFTQNTAYDKIIAFYTPAAATKTSATHRVYSGMFSFQEGMKDGEKFRCGLLIGGLETETSSKNGVYVGIQLVQTKVKKKKVYTADIIVEQYTNGTKNMSRQYSVVRQNVTGKRNIRRKDVFINPYDTNTITAIVGNNRELVVILNGSIITFPAKPASSSTEVGFATKLTVSNSVSTQSLSIDMPAIKLNSTPTLDGKRLAAWAGGTTTVKLNALKTYQLNLSEVNNNVQASNLSVIATILNENLFALSNKDELDSIIYGRRIVDNRNEISFAPDSVGREIREFDVEINSYPSTSNIVTRSGYTIPYTIKDKTTGKINQYVVNVPAESATFSVLRSSPTSLKFAIMNSYNAPIFLNKADNEAGVGANSMQILSKVLEKKDSGTVSQKLDRDGSSSEISVESDWIQSRADAEKILDYISMCAMMKKSSIEVEIFGNPTITIGDIVNLQFTQRNIPLKKYAVISTQLGFDNGITTKLRLRKVEE